jgi:hypothetical protein
MNIKSNHPRPIGITQRLLELRRCPLGSGKNGGKMKKTIFLILALVLAWCGAAQALETTLIETRNDILKNAQEMKGYFTTSRDPLLLNSMWDSSVMSVSQLDAYFSMLGIFNTIKNENLTADSVKYLLNWIKQVQETTDLNIKGLEAIKTTTDARSKVFALKLKDIFNNLKSKLAVENANVIKLQDSLVKK